MINIIYRNILQSINLTNLSKSQDILLCGGVVISYILDTIIILFITYIVLDILCRKYKRKSIIDILNEYLKLGI